MASVIENLKSDNVAIQQASDDDVPIRQGSIDFRRWPRRVHEEQNVDREVLAAEKGRQQKQMKVVDHHQIAVAVNSPHRVGKLQIRRTIGMPDFLD